MARGGIHTETQANRLTGKRRDQVILEKRLQGWSQTKIAEFCGCSQQLVSKRLHAVLARYAAEIRDKTEEYRSQQLMEIEQLKELLWKGIIEDKTISLGQLDRLLKIYERETKLMGLDLPAKIAITDPTGEYSALSDYEMIKTIVAKQTFELNKFENPEATGE